MVLLPHHVSKTLQVLPHLVALNLFLDFLLGDNVAHALSVVTQYVFSNFPKLDSTLLINQWVPEDRSVLDFGQALSLLLKHGRLRDGYSLTLGNAFLDHT